MGKTQSGGGQRGRASPETGNEPEVSRDSSEHRKTNETGARCVVSGEARGDGGLNPIMGSPGRLARC